MNEDHRGWFILLCTLLIVGLATGPSAGAGSWYSIVDGVKIIKVNANEEGWQADLKALLHTVGDSRKVLFEVHGVELNPSATEEYFPNDFSSALAKARGYDTVVLFEYVPEGKRFFGNPMRTENAANWLNMANIIVKGETGMDPGGLAHSQGSVVFNKGMDDGLVTWRELILVGATAPLTLDNVQRWEESISGTILDSHNVRQPAVFFIMKPGDVARGTQYIHTDYLLAIRSLGDRFLQPENPHLRDPVTIHNSYFTEPANERFFTLIPLLTDHTSSNPISFPSTESRLPPPKITLQREKVPEPPDSPGRFPPLCPFCDDGNGGGPGGVDFREISLTSISSNATAYPGGIFYTFNYVMEAEKAGAGEPAVNLAESSDLAYQTFFTGLTVPNRMFWVNLNPWEPGRLLGEDIRYTDAGRIMLEADLRMKRDFARYENPCEGETGTEFWKLLEAKEEALLNALKARHPDDADFLNGVHFSPVTRNWIVPGQTEYLERGDQVFLTTIALGIRSEPVSEHSTFTIPDQDLPFVSVGTREELNASARDFGAYARELEEKLTLPLVVRDVNTGRAYADLRTVYSSLALAQWYKKRFSGSPSLFQGLIDSRDTEFTQSGKAWNPEVVWKDYTRSFEEGDYHCWKNESRVEGDFLYTTNRLYSGGGVDFNTIQMTSAGLIPESTFMKTEEAVYESFSSEKDVYYFGDGFAVTSTGSGSLPVGDGSPKGSTGSSSPPLLSFLSSVPSLVLGGISLLVTILVNAVILLAAGILVLLVLVALRRARLRRRLAEDDGD